MPSLASAPSLLAPDLLTRRVLLALEVLDPVDGGRVTRGLLVRAKGLTGAPLQSASGLFVWLEERGGWPDEIAITPIDLPFDPQVLTPPRPPDPPARKPRERLVRAVLRPTAAYPLPAGLTAVRGRLRERAADDGSPPVAGAAVQLTWFDADAGAYAPVPPITPSEARTDASGAFGAFTRLPGASSVDVVRGRLKARLVFTREGATRATPEDADFGGGPAARGRIPEGALLALEPPLSWDRLLVI